MITTQCTKCDTPTEPIDFFPGDVCLQCWANSSQGRYLPTAQELRSIWGIK